MNIQGISFLRKIILHKTNSNKQNQQTVFECLILKLSVVEVFLNENKQSFSFFLWINNYKFHLLTPRYYVELLAAYF